MVKRRICLHATAGALLAVLWLSVCEGFTTQALVTSLTICSRPSTTVSRPNVRPCTIHKTYLNARQDNNEENAPLLPEPDFIASDFFAILIASELMGLLDDVNDPAFQGWLAPISGIPETLTELIARVSFLSVIWFGSSIVVQKVKWTKERRSGVIPGALQAGVAFSLGRVLLEVALHGGDPNLALVLRDCYFLTLAVTGFRFLYGQYFLFR